MSERSVIHHTFAIERIYPKPLDRVFSAFADPAQKRRWFAEGGGNDVDDFTMDFRVGGAERVRTRLGPKTPFPGAPLESNGVYLDIVPERRIVIAATMALNERRISASLHVFEFLPKDARTALVFTHQGAFFEGSDGPQMREAGWGQILEHLGSELAR
jgi:uncharacterized protein YndB with AHSA1/START domain